MRKNWKTAAKYAFAFALGIVFAKSCNNNSSCTNRASIIVVTDVGENSDCHSHLSNPEDIKAEMSVGLMDLRHLGSDGTGTAAEITFDSDKTPIILIHDVPEEEGPFIY